MIYNNIFLLLLLFIKIWIVYSEEIILNVIIYSFFDSDDRYYRLLSNDFNEYCREKGMDIYVQLEVLTPKISTTEFENYGTTIEALLSKKKNPKFDIYFYYSAYSEKFGNHFLNLKDYIPEEYIKGFDERILKETCSYNNELVGLPIHMDVSTLFSNQELLLKYNKEVPETWDELMSTSKYIYDEEKKLNNTIIRYNGLINDESGSVSLYEFINSYRESNESPPLKITSKTTIEALQKIKEMKDEIGEDIFTIPDDKTILTLLSGGNSLFLRYFYMMHLPMFKATALPGRKKGVSGTVVIPNNFGISKYISEERKKAAAEFLKFVSLKEIQKKYIITNNMFSAITELYDDEEVCRVIECDIIKNAYPFSFMDNDAKLFGDDNYHALYRETLFKYIYHDEPITEVLKEIEDITKIYTFSLKTDDTYIGLIIFIIFIILFTSMSLSLIFVFIKKYEKRFKFLSKDLWVLTTIGSLVLMSSIMTLYGDVNNIKCHLKVTLINAGFVLSLYPSLYKMIINFPERNKISLWFEKNKYISIIIIMVFTVILNELLTVSSYDLQKLTTSNEKNYEKCIMNKTFGSIIFYIIQFYNIFIISISLILIFIEWNLEETSLDVKCLETAFFMDILSLIILNIIDKIKFKNYVIYNTILASNILVFSISNYLFIYFIRVLPIFGNNNKNNEAKVILKALLNSDINDPNKHLYSTSIENTSTNDTGKTVETNFTSSNNNSKITEITKKIVNYHNRTSINEK